MVKKLKGTAKATAKNKKAKATATAKQKVIINIGKGGGGAKGKARATPRQPQQQQQQQQYQGPSHYDFTQLKSDILENVGNKFNQFVEKKASDILNIPSTSPTETTTTTYDVAGLVGAGTGLLKSAYDIYKDYSEGERKMRKYKVANVPIPTAAPVTAPNLEGVISRPLPVPRKPLLQPAPPKQEGKEREEKINPTNYDVPARPDNFGKPNVRPERRALPTAMERKPEPIVSIQQPEFVRKKTPAEISTEQMLADRDRRNKVTQEAKEAGKPQIPFLNFPPPPVIGNRPERRALPTVIEKKLEPQFSVGEESKEIIRGQPAPQFSVGEEPREAIRGQPVPSFLRGNQPGATSKAWEKSLASSDLKVKDILQQPKPAIIEEKKEHKEQKEEKGEVPGRQLLNAFGVKELKEMYGDIPYTGDKSSFMTKIINVHKQEAGIPVKPPQVRKPQVVSEEQAIKKLKADELKKLQKQEKDNIKKLEADRRKAEIAEKKKAEGLARQAALKKK